MRKLFTPYVFSSLTPISRLENLISLKGTFWLALVTSGLLLAAFTSRRVTQEEITQQLRQTVENQVAYFTDSIRGSYLSATFREVYSHNGYQPLWSENGQNTAQVNALLQALRQAEQEGLVPAAYYLSKLEQILVNVDLHPDAEKVAELDRWATASYLLYASHLLNGSLSPGLHWRVLSDTLPLAQYLLNALRGANVSQSLSDLLPPEDTGYHDLKQQLQHLKTIVRNGGWPVLSATRVLQKNDSGQAVTVLKRILYVMGDLDSIQANGSCFDHALQEGVRAFQQRHGLPATGKVDQATRQALNVPVEARIRQIMLNLERMRWLPRHLGNRFISVNIPEYKLRVLENRRQVLESNVVVGKRGHETPPFADTLEYIVFSPEWNVPDRIATQEILPLVQRNPYYLQKNNFRIYDSWRASAKPINPWAVDWQQVTPAHFRYRFVQQPSGKNALGTVKFLFPNPLNIYIHDTPAKRLFKENHRAFSHGCIRIENPEKLAICLLRNTGEWNTEKVQAHLHRAEPVKILLARPVPVYITYLTAFVQDGMLQFRDDVYGYDQAQLAMFHP